MSEICGACGYPIPSDLGAQVPCSKYHVRCMRCQWPVDPLLLSPKGLCEVCMEDAKRRADELMVEHAMSAADRHAVYAGHGLLWKMEKELILKTLADHHGNRTHAASALGICIRTMRNKLREYRADGENAR